MFKKIALSLFAVLFITGCQTTDTSIKKTGPKPTPLAQDTQNLKIQKIKVSPKELDLNKTKKVTVAFELTQKAEVTLKIYGEENELIFSRTANLNQGANTLEWNLQNSKAQLVANGVYTYQLIAENQPGQKDIFPGDKFSWGENIKVEKLNIDKKNNTINYLLPQAGRVRIRIGLKDGGPLLKTLIDWEPRLAGIQAEKWDGLDESKNMKLIQAPAVYAIVHAYTLPLNSIIVKGGKPYKYQQLKTKIENPKGKYAHALHPGYMCHEPKIKIELPEAEIKEGVPVVKEEAQLMIQIAPSDQAHLTDSRYEIILFIDNIFLIEDEEGYSPFTYLLNTKDIPDGEHLITVNVVSLDDHIGSFTKKIIVKNQKNINNITRE